MTSVISSLNADHPMPSLFYTQAMEKLIDVVRQLSQARDLETIMHIVRIAARDLTGADGATFVLRDNDHCYYAEENAISPLWKGKRFPLETCISGWVMHHGESATIEDIYKDPRIPVEAYRPTFVKSLAMVPIRKEAPIAAIGNYWANQHLPTKEELTLLEALAGTTAVAIENVQLYSNLQANIRILQERESRIAEQRDALEVFTRALAHDLKEPLRTITAFSELITVKTKQDPKTQQYLQHINKAGERMLMLIDTVFNYTQLDDPAQTAKEMCVTYEVVKAAMANLQRLIEDHHARIMMDDLPATYANRGQLLQIFQNLICNSIKHNDKQPTIHIAGKQEGNEIIFCVSDNGPGIEERYHDKIFQPFKRLGNHEEGGGLGLSICAKIVQLHGGKIWCESDVGKRTSFFFTLPLPVTETAVVPKIEITSEPATTEETRRILANLLVIDDRKSDRDLTRILLEDGMQLQCNLMIAESGQEGLDMLARQYSKDAPIDLVFLDINMPEMDGFEMLEQLRADDKLKRTAVVMCTGSTYHKDMERARAMGAVDYIVKPVQLNTMKLLFEKLPNLHLSQAGEGYVLQRSE